MLLSLVCHALYGFASLQHASNGCTDENPSCANWAASGECERSMRTKEKHKQYQPENTVRPI